MCLSRMRTFGRGICGPLRLTPSLTSTLSYSRIVVRFDGKNRQMKGRVTMRRNRRRRNGYWESFDDIDGLGLSIMYPLGILLLGLWICLALPSAMVRHR